MGLFSNNFLFGSNEGEDKREREDIKEHKAQNTTNIELVYGAYNEGTFENVKRANFTPKQTNDLQVLSINSFYSLLSKSGIKLSNEFLVTFIHNSGTYHDQQEQDAISLIHFLSTSTNLPNVDVQTTEASFMGVRFPIPTQYKLSDSIKFNAYCDGNMELYNVMYNWFNKISMFDNVNQELEKRTNQSYSDLESGGSIAPIYYYPNIIIDLLSHDFSKIIGSFVLYNVFPKNMTPLSVGHNSSTPMTFDIDFSYQYFKFIKSADREELILKAIPQKFKASEHRFYYPKLYNDEIKNIKHHIGLFEGISKVVGIGKTAIQVGDVLKKKKTLASKQSGKENFISSAGSLAALGDIGNRTFR